MELRKTAMLPPKPITTLCVDDDSTVLDVLRKFLISQGYDVFATTSVQEAIVALETKRHFTFCISDFQMPEMFGDDFLKIVAVKSPDTVRVLMSGYANKRRVQQASLNGTCCTFIEKPFQFETLIKILNRHLCDAGKHQTAG